MDFNLIPPKASEAVEPHTLLAESERESGCGHKTEEVGYVGIWS